MPNELGYEDSDLVLIGFGVPGFKGFRRATETEQREHADQLRIDRLSKEEATETRVGLLTGRDW